MGMLRLWKSAGLAVIAFLAAPSVDASEKRAPGEKFTDCKGCPKMIVIPAGEFIMGGSGLANEKVPDDELPQRPVRVPRPFAMARYEVTIGEFKKFAAATGRKPGDSCFGWDKKGLPGELKGNDWTKPGFRQSDTQPAVCVTWDEATEYAKWISSRTGKRYRLPSEAEWEYAARGGSSDVMPGETPGGLCKYGNVADLSAAQAIGDPAAKSWRPKESAKYRGAIRLGPKFSLWVGKTEVPWLVAPCRDGYALTTAPVGRFSANRFGLYDMVGNAWEWLADCWAEGYGGAPSDTTPRDSAPCKMRLLRSGAWAMNNDGWRYSDRDRDHPERRYSVVGFRLARDIED